MVSQIHAGHNFYAELKWDDPGMGPSSSQTLFSSVDDSRGRSAFSQDSAHGEEVRLQDMFTPCTCFSSI